MSDPSGLSDKTIGAIRGVFSRHPEIEEAILFGSRAKGTYRPGSDIDLALRGVGLDHRILSRIYSELDDLPIPYSFSLVVADEHLEPALQAHLDRVGVIFYAKHPAPKT